MADKELKPKSFRIDEETAEKFKEISAAIGGSQQETLAKLIETYEFQSGKAVLTEKKGEIEQFEKYVTALTRMFMSSLEDNQNLSETIRTEYDALLKSKDATIQDLQEKLAKASRLKEEAVSESKTYAAENARLEACIDSIKKEYDTKLDDMQSMLSDKENLNRALTDSCNDLKEKFEGIKETVRQTEALQEESENLKKEYEGMLKEKSELEKQLQREQSAHEADIKNLKKQKTEALEHLKEQSQLKLEKEVLKIEKQYEEQIQELKAGKQEEIDKYQQKYFDLLEQMKEQKAAVKEN